jgi:O-antigen ligase
MALALLALWIVRKSRETYVDIFPRTISWPIFGFSALVMLQLLCGTTAYRYATLSESQNLITYAVLMLVAGDAFVRRRRLRTFVFAMAIFGCGLSLFSILQGLSGTDRIYGLRSIDAISAAIYGPFVNHNHYAGLMEMLVPLAGASAVFERGSKRFLLIFGTALMVLSVGLSRSRGGMIALALELLFVCLVLYRRKRDRRGLLTLLGVAALIASFVLLIGSDRIVDRLSETQDSYRLKIYKDGLQMALHKPILGYGMGTFPYVYPTHRSFHTNLFVNHAHSDYLEVLVDTGLVGLGFCVWMLVGVFRSGMTKISEREDPEGNLLTLAALTGITGIVVHSFLDFNLHVPANAALFFVLCAAVATPFKNRIKPARFQHWKDDISLDESEIMA